MCISLAGEVVPHVEAKARRVDRTAEDEVPNLCERTY